MTLYNVVGTISTLSLLLPIITIFILRLAWYKSFPALLIYYTIVFTYNIFWLNYIKVGDRFIHYYGILNNLMDAPLMLTFMTYFSQTAQFRKKMKMFIPIFLVFEAIIIGIYGFSTKASVIVMAPGLLVVLILSILFFIHQVKITVIHQKAAGKAFMVAALLFAYGGYSFLYTVYYILDTQYKTDTYLVYFLVSIFSSLLISAGVLFERKRVNQLTEVQTTRKELRLIYGGADGNSATPKKRFY